MPFAATWMDLEIITLSEVSQTEKDKYHMISPGNPKDKGASQATARGSSQLRDQTRVSYVSCIGRRILYHYPPGKPKVEMIFFKYTLATQKSTISKYISNFKIAAEIRSLHTFLKNKGFLIVILTCKASESDPQVVLLSFWENPFFQCL